jgi:hypothetical protein
MSASPTAVKMLLATALLLVPIASFAQSGGGEAVAVPAVAARAEWLHPAGPRVGAPLPAE